MSLTTLLLWAAAALAVLGVALLLNEVVYRVQAWWQGRWM